MEDVIGRENEQKYLKTIEDSDEPELIAVYGRRRIGKTFLIRNGFSQPLAFEFSGTQHATLDQELENFSNALTKAMGGPQLARPNSWIAAFQMLIKYLTPLTEKRRSVIFFDEFPWINSPRSGFLSAFGHFWNSWASTRNKLVVVICGSAASWMIKNIVRNRGGLHNRVTRRIRLLPFTVAETAKYLKRKKIKLDNYQVLQLYMALGGVPQYLKEIQPGESAAQAVDKLCFMEGGLLTDEFNSLYYSLFDNAEHHIDIIRALTKKNSGLTRSEIIDTCKLTSGGYTTKLLDELTESAFIAPYAPFGKISKDSIYKLTDEYSLFYIRFMENSKAKGQGTWQLLSTGASWKSWSGLAFESICLKHIDLIKAAIGIKSVYSETSAWRYRPKTADEQGAQIDLLIDRADRCINICEMKFTTGPFEITKPYAKELDNKLSVFRQRTKTRKVLFMILVTTYGVKNVRNYAGLIENEVTMEVLFKR